MQNIQGAADPANRPESVLPAVGKTRKFPSGQQILQGWYQPQLFLRTRYGGVHHRVRYGSQDIAGGERQTGSEGYYVRIYKDKLAVLGRDFVTGEWVSSAQFIVNLSTKTEDDITTKDDETTASAPESGDATTEISTSAPAPETTSAPDTGSADNAGCGSTVSAPFAILSVIIIGAAITKKRD